MARGLGGGERWAYLCVLSEGQEPGGAELQQNCTIRSSARPQLRTAAAQIEMGVRGVRSMEGRSINDEAQTEQ